MTFGPASGVPKPRAHGRTNILDKGLGLAALDDLLAVAAPFVDLAKIGWGTSLVLPDLDRRLDVYRSHDVDVCCGGTLFEYAYAIGEVDEYRAWLREHGFDHVEISNGTIDIDTEQKLAAIEQFAADFTVFSEVGSKDADAIVSPARWVRSIQQELGAGASSVILEGRESGTAGMYRKSGEMRTGLIDEVLEAGIDPHQLVFEAPLKQHQVYLIRLIGADVNLANIAPEEAVPLETLRRGLRSDTLAMFHAGVSAD
jgi:phosphosulfolactate synthase